MAARRSRLQLRPNIRVLKAPETVGQIKEKSIQSSINAGSEISAISNNNNDQNELVKRRRVVKQSPALPQRVISNSKCSNPPKEKHVTSLENSDLVESCESQNSFAQGDESCNENVSCRVHEEVIDTDDCRKASSKCCDPLEKKDVKPLENADMEVPNEMQSSFDKCGESDESIEINKVVIDTEKKDVCNKVISSIELKQLIIETENHEYRSAEKIQDEQLLQTESPQMMNENCEKSCLFANGGETSVVPSERQIMEPPREKHNAHNGDRLQKAINSSIVTENKVANNGLGTMPSCLPECENDLNCSPKNTKIKKKPECVKRKSVKTQMLEEGTPKVICKIGKQKSTLDDKRKLKSSISRFRAKQLPNLKKNKITVGAEVIKSVLNSKKKNDTSSISVGTNSDKTQSILSLPNMTDENNAKKKTRLSVPLKEKNSLKSDKEICNKKKYKIKRAPEQNTMTMLDLIYWNPEENSIQNVEKEVAKEKDTVVENEVDDPSVLVASNAEVVAGTSVEENCVNDDTDMLIPRVIIDANGEITIDENSLVVQKTAESGPIQSETIYDDNEATYSSFRSKSSARGWSKKETTKFYKALCVFGTNFSLMENLFPSRTRHQLKLKFKREEKSNRNLVDKTLETPPVFDLTLFESNSEDEIDEEQTEVASSKRKKNSKRKQRKTGQSNIEMDSELNVISKKKSRKRRGIPRTYDASDSEEERYTELPLQPPFPTISGVTKSCLTRSQDMLLNEDNENGDKNNSACNMEFHLDVNNALQQESLPLEVECCVDENYEIEFSPTYAKSNHCNRDKLSADSTNSNTSASNCVRTVKISNIENSSKTLSPKNTKTNSFHETVAGERPTEVSCYETNADIQDLQDCKGPAPFTSHGLMIIGPNEKKLIFPKSFISTSVKHLTEHTDSE